MLVLADVTKTYGDLTALNHVSATLPRGSVVGLIGVNGAGKTTLMRIITGLMQPDSGRLEWADGSRPRFGYMPEERGLYESMVVRDLVAYFARLAGVSKADVDREVTSTLERVVASQLADRKVSELSLGNRQRVQLAVSLLNDPELLVLDEPFSGIDPLTTEHLVTLIRDEARTLGRTVVISSHQLDFLQSNVDSLILLNKGNVLANGDARELLEEHGGGQRYDIDVRDVSADWLDGLTGVSLEEVDGDRYSVMLERGTDVGPLIARAQQRGELRALTLRPKRLVDLLSELVTDHA